MKYLLLIHQGDTPPPGTPEWERFSQDDQNAVYGDYQAVRRPGSRRASGCSRPKWPPPSASRTARH